MLLATGPVAESVLLIFYLLILTLVFIVRSAAITITYSNISLLLSTIVSFLGKIIHLLVLFL